MPVLDLDDFLKKNATQKATEPLASASSPTGAETADPRPFAAFTNNLPNTTGAVAGDLLDYQQKTERALSSLGQDLLQLTGRVAALEHDADATHAKTGQLIAIIDRAQLGKVSSDLSDLRSQLSSLKATGAPAVQDSGGGMRPAGPDVLGSVHQLETEYIELSSRMRPMEVALEQLRAWADRDKEYFIKTDDAHHKLSELERKIALKSDYPSEQIMSRAQFEKYSKMADMDRQQLRLSIDSLRETVSQVSASVDRFGSVVAGNAAYGPPIPDGLEAKVDAHAKVITELQARSDAEGLDKYAKELEKTRAEVSANYEQVKVVERLLTAQSNKMQTVFSEIQKNLSEYKLTSDTINSTHEAVLHDIGALKAEHEHGIEDYRRIAADLSQKVEQNAHAVAEMHLMINGLQYETNVSGGAAKQARGETGQDSAYARAEQKRLLEETSELSATVADLVKKATAFQEQAAKIAGMEETLLRVEHKANDSDANNAAMFANITTGFSELKKRMENISSVGPAPAPDALRMIAVEKGVSDLGKKVNSLENENTALFADLSKSVSKLKSQVDSLQAAGPASHSVSATPDGRVTFAPASALPTIAGQDSTLLFRIDALERSISSLKAQVPPANALSANVPAQFKASESTGDGLRQFEERLVHLEAFKGELESWKEQTDGVSAKVDSLCSSHAQLVQEVASAISGTQTNAFADDQFAKAQAEEARVLLAELKVQTELLSSKLAATENNVSMIVGQRFSQLQTQADRVNADVAALKVARQDKTDLVVASERQAKALAVVDAKLSRTIDERFSKAQQALSQQSTEFAGFRDAMPEKLRLAVAAAESRQADALGAVDTKVAKLSAEWEEMRGLVRSLAEFETKQEKTVSEFESRAEASIITFETAQTQMLATFEAKQAEALSALDARQADIAAALEVRESQTTSALDALRVGVAAQKTDAEKLAAALTGRMDTLDAFSRSISELLSTTKTEVSSSVENLRKEQQTELAGIRTSQDAASKALRETDARLSTIEAHDRGQQQALAEVRAANAVLDQRMVGVLAALESIAALSRDLEAQRIEVRNTVKELRAAFNVQAVAQVQDAQKQILAQPAAPEAQDAKTRQAALEANLSDLENAIAEIDSKMPAAPQPVARPQQFVRQQAPPQPRMQQQATQYVRTPPRAPPAAPQYAPQPQAPQPVARPQPRQEYYAPQADQQVRRDPPRTISSSIRPMQRPSPRMLSPQYSENSSLGSGSADSAQTEADKQAMDLMAELRGKLLGDTAPKPEKKDSAAGEERKEQQ